MKEIGTVNKVEGIDIHLTCGSDAACKGCAAGALCKTKGRSIIALNRSHIDLAPGDHVEIFLPPGRTIFAGFSVLIFPLLTFIAGFVLAGTALPESGEGTRALFGLAGLGLGFLLSYLYNRSAKSRNYPFVTRKLEN